MRSTTCLVTVLVLSALACRSSADITTLFARNNGGSFGGAVYFDLNIGPSDLLLTGIDTNTNETVVFDFDVWVLAGLTSQGNETNGSPWVLATSGTGIGAGLNLPSPVTLNSPFLFNANTLYGVALVMGPQAGHDYTNGNGGNQFYSNADLSLQAGSATNAPFIGTVFSPRVWNGTLYYTPVPEPTSCLVCSACVIGLFWYAGRRKASRASRATPRTS